jgi:uncharacterized protein
MAAPNDLIHARSPYLLQHAHNPVAWREWSEDVFVRARAENRLVLVSIGYSSCHWCHVMERECFEDPGIAEIMNKHYINVKVDREERPDVDHVYMTAVQLMSGHGGWPLNCFVLPDGRPVYGGTYFPKARWTEVLLNLAHLYKQSPEKVQEYADQLTQGIRQVNEFSHLSQAEESGPDREELDEAVAKWKRRFDKAEGGSAGAPKFPMPVNNLFLLRYGVLAGHEDLVKHVHLTLHKMARGGIYDQLGGGFARYSTDSEWKVPHFEKMLYDNAQLVSLYCEAYRQQPDELYKQVVYETLAFVQREMTSPEGGFYSALDADSEGREGLFYTWTKEELQEVLGKDFGIFADYYSVNEDGYWEDDQYILLRKAERQEVCRRHSLAGADLDELLVRSRQRLMQRRALRVRPGLDDKLITSWNGLMASACAEAYATFGEAEFLEAAKRSLAFTRDRLLQADGALYRCARQGEAYGTAFLDDYAFMCDAFLRVFCLTGEELLLQQAVKMTEYCYANFYSAERALFYYAPKRGENLIAKNFEISDNVIPASNSQIALNLQHLFVLTGQGAYDETWRKMLGRMRNEVTGALPAHANWAVAGLRQLFNFYEVCVVGKDVDEFRKAFAKGYHPNAIFAFSKTASEIALLAGRFREGQTLAYVCTNQSCQAPVKTPAEALEQLK